jgi:hypothetical protein
MKMHSIILDFIDPIKARKIKYQRNTDIRQTFIRVIIGDNLLVITCQQNLQCKLQLKTIQL